MKEYYFVNYDSIFSIELMQYLIKKTLFLFFHPK
jgi:hypothetical protein